MSKIIATGTKVTYSGKVATVISGNAPDEWNPENSPFISIKFDTSHRGYPKQDIITAYATDVEFA